MKRRKGKENSRGNKFLNKWFISKKIEYIISIHKLSYFSFSPHSLLIVLECECVMVAWTGVMQGIPGTRGIPGMVGMSPGMDSTPGAT